MIYKQVVDAIIDTSTGVFIIDDRFVPVVCTTGSITL
jgi:hypothetical protein